MNNHDHDGHDLLTITEAADLLRTPVATLRYWRHLGTGPHSFRLGRRVLYRANDLHRWVNAQADEHAPKAATINLICTSACPTVDERREP